jgi:hypothetical protein
MPWEGMRERAAGDSVLVNGARGTRDIEGKVTRVGASEHGLRTSFKTKRERNFSPPQSCRPTAIYKRVHS